MKTIKLLLLIMLVINSSNVSAKIKRVKESNNIIQIETESAHFAQYSEGVWFDFRMALELYTNKTEKQYALKFSTRLKDFTSFKTNSKVTFNFMHGIKQSLHTHSVYTYNDAENSYIIIPVTSNDVENMINYISSIQFEVLVYEYDHSEYTEIGIQEKLLLHEYDEKGWDKQRRLHNIVKKLKKQYNDINKEFEKLKAKGFVFDSRDYKD